MAGMTDKDTKEVSKLIKEIAAQSLAHSRSIDEILKMTSQDKDMAPLAKDLSAAHKPLMKAVRSLLDKAK
ncbi:MAG TPA: hypothetical protein VLA78_04985 [Paracoccaceae bacterium]|nr:hypothetical protein [Paracoccaceae bacterium]